MIWGTAATGTPKEKKVSYTTRRVVSELIRTYLHWSRHALGLVLGVNREVHLGG